MADRFTHHDGRLCFWLPYTVHGVAGLQHGYFYVMDGIPARCHREHGLEGAEDEPAES